MIKREKDDGFTLIELMIVIAVIGILAVVLVPKIGNVKNSAKITGVQANYQSVLAAVQSFNQLNATNACGTATGSVENQLTTYFSATNTITNPFSNIAGVGTTVLTTTGTLSPLGSAIAVDTADNATVISFPTNVAYAGTVGVYPYVNATSQQVFVQVVGYDQAGAPIAGMTTTIQP